MSNLVLILLTASIFIGSSALAEKFECESLVSLDLPRKNLSRKISEELRRIDKKTLLKRDEMMKDLASTYTDIAKIFPYMKTGDEFKECIQLLQELNNVKSESDLKNVKSKYERFHQYTKAASRKSNPDVFKQYVESKPGQEALSQVSGETMKLVSKLAQKEQIYCTNIRQVGAGVGKVVGIELGAGTFKCLNPDGTEKRNLSLSPNLYLGAGLYIFTDEMKEVKPAKQDDLIRGFVVDEPTINGQVVLGINHSDKKIDYSKNLRVGLDVSIHGLSTIIALAISTGSADAYTICKSFVPDPLKNLLNEQVIEMSPSLKENMIQLGKLEERVQVARRCEHDVAEKVQHEGRKSSPKKTPADAGVTN